jgi:hypothetical protein
MIKNLKICWCMNCILIVDVFYILHMQRLCTNIWTLSIVSYIKGNIFFIDFVQNATMLSGTFTIQAIWAIEAFSELWWCLCCQFWPLKSARSNQNMSLYKVIEIGYHVETANKRLLILTIKSLSDHNSNVRSIFMFTYLSSKALWILQNAVQPSHDIFCSQIFKKVKFYHNSKIKSWHEPKRKVQKMVV